MSSFVGDHVMTFQYRAALYANVPHDERVPHSADPGKVEETRLDRNPLDCLNHDYWCRRKKKKKKKEKNKKSMYQCLTCNT